MTAEDGNSGARRDGRCYAMALSKHLSVVMNAHATIEELLEVMFSMQCMPFLCSLFQGYIMRTNRISQSVAVEGQEL
jgi:hypothetical protein